MILFSHRDRVFNAIRDPEAIVGPRLGGEGWLEHIDNWRARAAIEAMMQLACESRSFAQAIEARRAETGTGSVADESAVGPADAPNPTHTTTGG